MSDTEKVLGMLQGLVRAMFETVNEAGPQGVPAGILYAACQAYDCPLEAFNQIMAALVNANMITKRGHVYYPVKVLA